MLEALLSAGTSLISGLLGKSSQDKANEIAQQNAANNIALQREYAQNAIQWKVADAKAAGVHPLYALGASTTSFSPVAVGVSGGNPLGEGIARAGQDIGRALQSGRTAGGREQLVAQQAAALTLERGQLENELLRTQIASARARLTAPQVGPAVPTTGDNYMVPGQANSPLIKPKALNVAPGSLDQPSSEGGAITDVGYARTTTGWAPVPSADVKERIEDQLIPEAMWAWRNNVLPTIGKNMAPPPFKPPPGKVWDWNPAAQEYQLFDAGHWWPRLGRFLNPEGYRR
jgi:hypothetical protein